MRRRGRGGEDGGVTIQRLLRLKHDRHELGFLSARVMKDDGALASWLLRVESPAELEEFRRHLATGSTMSLNMVTREGDHLRGEAAVSTVSDATGAATVVTLAGLGPLYSS
jgi:hypothetical protein